MHFWVPDFEVGACLEAEGIILAFAEQGSKIAEHLGWISGVLGKFQKHLHPD